MAARSFVQPAAHLPERSTDPAQFAAGTSLALSVLSRARCGPSMVDGRMRGSRRDQRRNQMKKMNQKSKDQSIDEQDLSDLTIKKLTLKTGVKAGMMGTCEISCCPKTCHG
jgi:hypothetical protein